jgi:DnaJ like chaperone protein
MDKDKKDFQINILWLPTILAMGILYVISFIDMVPDVVPLFGQLDDVAVALAIIWFFTAWLPKNLHRVYWRKPQPNERPKGEASGRRLEAERRQERLFDPFKVLNIERGASPEEIKRAYREMLSKYHPDKVNHLGEDFQRLAHGKAVEIMKAYEMLSGKE